VRAYERAAFKGREEGLSVRLNPKPFTQNPKTSTISEPRSPGGRRAGAVRP